MANYWTEKIAYNRQNRQIFIRNLAKTGAIRLVPYNTTFSKSDIVSLFWWEISLLRFTRKNQKPLTKINHQKRSFHYCTCSSDCSLSLDCTRTLSLQSYLKWVEKWSEKKKKVQAASQGIENRISWNEQMLNLVLPLPLATKWKEHFWWFIFVSVFWFLRVKRRREISHQNRETTSDLENVVTTHNIIAF